MESKTTSREAPTQNLLDRLKWTIQARRSKQPDKLLAVWFETLLGLSRTTDNLIISPDKELRNLKYPWSELN